MSLIVCQILAHQQISKLEQILLSKHFEELDRFENELLLLLYNLSDKTKQNFS